MQGRAVVPQVGIIGAMFFLAWAFILLTITRFLWETSDRRG